jgi:release factor glutamine methyltransferase
MPGPTRKPLELVGLTTDYFKKKNIESPRLNAELLLAEVLQCERVRLYVDFEKPLKEEEVSKYREFVRRRGENREPLQYIVGHAPFLELTLKVTPAVLIPRPETEELAEWGRQALDAYTAETHPELKVLDIGTGTGCLALYLAAKNQRVQAVAVDISPDALAVATENRTHCAVKFPGIETRVEFLQSDVFNALPAERKGTFHVLVSNPPYIDPDLRETLQPEVVKFEPSSALFTEEKGLLILNRILKEAHEWLIPGGKLGLEISPEQAVVLKNNAENMGPYEQVEIKKDLHGRERSLMAVRKSV